ncbi:thiamine-binding protein [Pseudokineococcus sp. 1T1Z-3]|uniref:thiamine-binding protein n=1 Tax=Pseudokineococcus sp. 1T1Z-3 TaxID=3132745 RepID=UPI0030AC9CC7
MLVAFSVAPSGVGDSVSAAVADAVQVVRDSGLPHRTDSMFTTLEGSWDEVMDVVRRATEAVGRHGDRVSLVLKADLRTGAAAGRAGEMQAKLDRLEDALGRAGSAAAGRPTDVLASTTDES